MRDVLVVMHIRACKLVSARACMNERERGWGGGEEGWQMADGHMRHTDTDRAREVAIETIFLVNIFF